jgi:hypothetical protein
MTHPETDIRSLANATKFEMVIDLKTAQALGLTPCLN